MRLLLFTFLFFFGQALMAQLYYMPYELEREEASAYAEFLENRDTHFTTELEALEFYFLNYKEQRANNPANYFPSVNSGRMISSKYLKNNFPTSSGMALVNFLENAGSIESCRELLERKSGYKLLLPYRFMAASILEDHDLQSAYLAELDSEGMLSDVLKAFGENALFSINEIETVATQGMQDLIAIKFALNQQDIEKRVLNLFAENCQAYKEKSVSSALSKKNKPVWLSPLISGQILLENQSNLYQSGIGFLYSQDELSVYRNLHTALIETGKNFHGLNTSPSSIADRGLIGAYRYFAEAYTNYVNKENGEEELEQSEKINRFIKNEK